MVFDAYMPKILHFRILSILSYSPQYSIWGYIPKELQCVTFHLTFINDDEFSKLTWNKPLLLMLLKPPVRGNISCILYSATPGCKIQSLVNANDESRFYFWLKLTMFFRSLWKSPESAAPSPQTYHTLSRNCILWNDACIIHVVCSINLLGRLFINFLNNYLLKNKTSPILVWKWSQRLESLLAKHSL